MKAREKIQTIGASLSILSFPLAVISFSSLFDTFPAAAMMLASPLTFSHEIPSIGVGSLLWTMLFFISVVLFSLGIFTILGAKEGK